MKKIIYKNVIGTVLGEGRGCYFIAFPYGCKFIDKTEISPMWGYETQEAKKPDPFEYIPQFLSKRLNA